MAWKTFLFLSIDILVAGTVIFWLFNNYAKKRPEKKSLSSLYFVGVIGIAATLLFVPIYIDFFKDSGNGRFCTVKEFCILCLPAVGKGFQTDITPAHWVIRIIKPDLEFQFNRFC